MSEQSNCITISKADLGRTLKSIYTEVMQREGRAGLPRISYQDDHDSFEMLLTDSNRGFSVSCRLNNSQSYQLNGQFFAGASAIGQVMLVAAGANYGDDYVAFFA